MASLRVGLKEVVIAKQLTDVKGGSSTWDTPIALECAATAALTPVGAMDKYYGDDGVCDVNESYVGEDIALTIADITQEIYALLMGHTYSAGGVLKATGDTSPYFAVGYKVKKSNGKYIYRWLFKVKFKKSANNAETLKDATTFQPYALEGSAIPLQSNGQIEYTLSNDDPAYNTSQWSGFFTTVTTLTTDNTALTCTITKGAGGDAGKILFTFAKGSAASFSISSTLVSSSSLPVVGGSGVRAGSYATGGAGTTVVIKFTPTVAFATESIGAFATNDIKDNSGVAATPTGITFVYP